MSSFPSIKLILVQATEADRVGPDAPIHRIDDPSFASDVEPQEGEVEQALRGRLERKGEPLVPDRVKPVVLDGFGLAFELGWH